MDVARVTTSQGITGMQEGWKIRNLCFFVSLFSLLEGVAPARRISKFRTLLVFIKKFFIFFTYKKIYIGRRGKQRNKENKEIKNLHNTLIISYIILLLQRIFLGNLCRFCPICLFFVSIDCLFPCPKWCQFYEKWRFFRKNFTFFAAVDHPFLGARTHFG